MKERLKLAKPLEGHSKEAVDATIAEWTVTNLEIVQVAVEALVAVAVEAAAAVVVALASIAEKPDTCPETVQSQDVAANLYFVICM